MTKSTEERVSELETRMVQLETAMSKTEPQQSAPTLKKLSAKEFLLTKNIKTDLHKTLALAFYLERMGGMSSFNVNDLADAYRSAKEKRPGNLSDTIGKNMARGLLMGASEKDGKKAWTLTVTGEKFIEVELKK